VKRVLAALFLASLATAVVAQQSPVDAGSLRHHFPAHNGVIVAGSFGDVGDEADGSVFRAHGSNLIYHNGGQVIPSAHVVFIFWGPSFSGGSDATYASTLRAFRDQFGTTGEYNVITQYYQIIGGVQTFISQTNLGGGTPDMFDTTTPPTNVTDAIVQGEVNHYLASNAFDPNTIYEVVIPATSYSSDGTSTSCGGPNLAYCAYHGFFTSGANKVKYSIEPYPSCSGCSLAGWSNVQNQEHFVCH